MIDRDDTAIILAVLKQLDPQGWVDIGDAALDVWTLALNEPVPIPFEAAVRVATETAATADRFPRPREFRAAVLARVSGLPTVAQAKAQIQRDVRENYPGLPVRFEPHRLVLAAAKDVGGIHKLRNAKDEHEQRQWWKAFEEAYTGRHQDAAATVDIEGDWLALAGGTDRKAIAS